MRKSSATTRVFLAIASLALTSMLAFSYRQRLFCTIESPLDSSNNGAAVSEGVVVRDKVATITETLFTPHLIPVILHFHAVLGPSWPIVFFTSQQVYDEHFSASANAALVSAAWKRAIAERSIETRTVPSRFELTTRRGSNIYLSDPWLWRQLAPAKNVLVFQADSIICANANRTVDEFLEYDFIGSPLRNDSQWFNGGLSLRNRGMLLEILSEGRDWWTDTNTMGTEYEGHGEDVWLSVLMRTQGANLPSIATALQFAKQLGWHFSTPERPVGYHRVHKLNKNFVPVARKVCPEIDLTSPGSLK